MAVRSGTARSVIAVLAWLGVAVLGGCGEEPLPRAGRYLRQDRVQTVPLFFVPGSAVLTASGARRLRVLGPGLPADAVLTLAAPDGLVDERAREVALALDRPVFPASAATAGPPGLAQLSVKVRAVVATDCLGPAPRFDRDNWPGDDESRTRLLPPGCAAATVVQRMAVDQDDLLRGRPLPPGAAFPVARAIERYYDRWNGTAATSAAAARPAAAPGPGAGSGPGSPAAASGASAEEGADLLQGPLQPVGSASGGTAGSPAEPAR